MKRIGQVVTPLFKQKMDPQQLNKKIERVAKHPLLCSFRQEHPEWRISPADYTQLEQYITEKTHCQHCPGLEKCPNFVQGHYPSLQLYGGTLSLKMAPCEKLRQDQLNKERKRLIRCQRIPQDIQEARFTTIAQDPSRKEVVRASLAFCMKLAQGQPTKGLYIHGPFGVGKSYIAGAIVNELAEHGIASMMMHMSALSVEVKESIAGHNVGAKIEALSEVPVLVLDDIGSENISPWLRDDVLSIIFHYRMSKQLPTIYTSNLSLDELQEYFCYTQKGGLEEVKGARIMERIRPFVTPVYLQGQNRRYL